MRAKAREATGRARAAERAAAEYKHELGEAQEELERVRAESARRDGIIRQLEARLADVGMGMGSVGATVSRASPARSGTPGSVGRPLRGTPTQAGGTDDYAQLRRAHARCC
jgi:hypothetical protein